MKPARVRVKGSKIERRHPQLATHQVAATPTHDPTPRRARRAVAVHPAGNLNGQHAEISDQLIWCHKAVDIEDEDGEHGCTDSVDAGNGVAMALLRWYSAGTTTSSDAAKTPLYHVEQRGRDGRLLFLSFSGCVLLVPFFQLFQRPLQ